MNKVYKYLVASFSISIFLIALSFIDDDLNLEAKVMYEQAIHNTESEAYVYLMGLPVADKEPELAGKALLKAIRKTEKEHLTNPCTVINGTTEYPKTKEIPLLMLASCGKDCGYLDKLFATSLDIKAINKLEPLYKRYNKFMSFKDYHNLAKPTLSTPLPTYQYLMKGSDFINYMAIQSAKNKDRNAATTLLLKNISNLRLRLQQADTIIDKMIYALAISRSIDVLSVLKHKNQAFGVKINPLTLEERSLVPAMSYEFAIQYSFSKAMGGCPSVLSKGAKIPSLLSKVLYKPNMTINSYFPHYKKAASNSLLNDKEFIKKVKIEPEFKPKSSTLRNYAGSILTQIIAPKFNHYIARVFALDAKIKLYNSTIKQVELPKDVTHISNPFYQHKTAFYSQDKKSICFDIDLIKREDDRCLRVGL